MTRTTTLCAALVLLLAGGSIQSAQGQGVPDADRDALLLGIPSGEVREPAVTCRTEVGVLLSSPTLQSFSGVGNPSACCALCSTTKSCVAWSITGLSSAAETPPICNLKASIGQQQRSPSATSGILGNGPWPEISNHYGNPYPGSWSNASGSACQPDEIDFEMNGIHGPNH